MEISFLVFGFFFCLNNFTHSFNLTINVHLLSFRCIISSKFSEDLISSKSKVLLPSSVLSGGIFFLENVLLPIQIVFVSLKLIFKPVLIFAKQSSVCSIPSIMMRTHPSSEMDVHVSSAYLDIFHSLPSMLIPSIPKMPIQHCWYRINIKENHRQMLL